jgi:hypothetical protein
VVETLLQLDPHPIGRARIAVAERSAEASDGLRGHVKVGRPAEERDRDVALVASRCVTGFSASKNHCA